MTAILDYVRWAIRLWLTRTSDSLEWKYRGTKQRAYEAFESKTRVIAFLDRIDPFDPLMGYRHQRIRALVALVTTPLYVKSALILRALWIVDRFAPYTGPGRFESNALSDRLKVEWIVEERSEYESDSFGNTEEYGAYLELYRELKVPWSFELESWLIQRDGRGFIYGMQALNAQTAQEQFDRERALFDEWLAEDEDDNWTNREGMPEFNGAFR